MAEKWYQYNITNPHSSDDGVDIGTPNNTPVFFPYGGQVIDAHYYTYGGQVVVHMPGQQYDEYFIHLNDINVRTGDTIQPGQIIGTTGGGIGDLLLKNGTVQQATSQADFLGASTGYHTEFGEFKDTSAHGDMGQFNEGWGGEGGKRNGRQLDPTSVIDELRNPASGLQIAIAGATGQPVSGVQGATSGVQKALNAADPATWGPAIITSLGFSSPGDMFARVGGTIGGMVLIGLGVFVAFQPEAQQAIQTVEKVAGTAAKAAAL